MTTRLDRRTRPNRPSRVGRGGSGSGGGGTPQFDPADYGTVIQWWDASDESSIDHVGGVVSEWNSKAGSLMILSSASGTEPTTGATTVNGRNVLDFDGTEFLTSTSPFIQDNAAALIVVYRDTGDNNTVVGEGRTASANGMFTISNLVTSTNVRTYHETNTAVTKWNVSTGNPSNAAGGIRFTYSRTSYAPNTDVSASDSAGGTGSASGVSSGTFTPNRLTVGALERNTVTSHITGWVAEIIALSAVTDLAGLEAAVDDKWGL